MIGRRMTSACWCQLPKSHRVDFIRWSGKLQCSCFQYDSLTFYATPFLVSYPRFVRPFHIMVKTLVMSRNIAKSMAQMSHCPKYSPESIFSEVTAAIVDAVEPFPPPHQPILDPRLVATSDASWCPSVYSQPSLLHLSLTFFAPTFLARSHHITSSSWRSLKSMLSSQATFFFF